MIFGVDSRAELAPDSRRQAVNAVASVTPFNPVDLKRSDSHFNNGDNHTNSTVIFNLECVCCGMRYSNMGAIVQYISHSLTRASWVTVGYSNVSVIVVSYFFARASWVTACL